MSLSDRTLFTAEPIEIKRDETLRALDGAVARLRPVDLADPALPAKLVERLLPRPPRLGARVRYRLFEVETGGRDDDSGPGRWAPASRPPFVSMARRTISACAPGRSRCTRRSGRSAVGV